MKSIKHNKTYNMNYLKESMVFRVHKIFIDSFLVKGVENNHGR